MTTATLRIRYRRQACSASRVHNATALVLLRSFRCQDVAHTFHEGSGPAQVSRTRRFAYLKRISHTLYDNEKHLNAMHVLQVQMSPSSRAHDWLCKILCSPGYTTPDMMAGQSSCRPVYHAQPEHVEHSRAHFSADLLCRPWTPSKVFGLPSACVQLGASLRCATLATSTTHHAACAMPARLQQVLRPCSNTIVM